MAAEWYGEHHHPERTLQDKGVVIPSESESGFLQLRRGGTLRVSPQDKDWLKKLVNIIWEDD